MVEFVVSKKDLNKGIRMLLVGRTEHMLKDTADFVAVADMLKLASTGTSTEMHAVIVQAGYVRVPLPVLKNVKKIASTFKGDQLRIKMEAGRIKVATFSFSHPDIETCHMGTRIADVPVNASLLDTLAMQKLYSAEELAESGLAARVLEAQQAAEECIVDAADSLSQFGVPVEAVALMLEAHITLHAKALHATLRKTTSA